MILCFKFFKIYFKFFKLVTPVTSATPVSIRNPYLRYGSPSPVPTPPRGRAREIENDEIYGVTPEQEGRQPNFKERAELDLTPFVFFIRKFRKLRESEWELSQNELKEKNEDYFRRVVVIIFYFKYFQNFSEISPKF